MKFEGLGDRIYKKAREFVADETHNAPNLRDIPLSEFSEDGKKLIKRAMPIVAAGAVAFSAYEAVAAKSPPTSIEDLIARDSAPRSADDAIGDLIRRLEHSPRRPDMIARLIEGLIDSAESPMAGVPHGETEVMCLAKNIYFEAANQTEDGKRAVGLVTLLRVLSGKYPKSACGVVYQGHDTPSPQFSWTKEPEKYNAVPQNKTFESISQLATELYSYRHDPVRLKAEAAKLGITPDTLFYKRHDWNEHDRNDRKMSNANKWFWQTCLEPTQVDGQPLRIGDHVFYRPSSVLCTPYKKAHSK